MHTTTRTISGLLVCSCPAVAACASFMQKLELAVGMKVFSCSLLTYKVFSLTQKLAFRSAHTKVAFASFRSYRSILTFCSVHTSVLLFVPLMDYSRSFHFDVVVQLFRVAFISFGWAHPVGGLDVLVVCLSGSRGRNPSVPDGGTRGQRPQEGRVRLRPQPRWPAAQGKPITLTKVVYVSKPYDGHYIVYSCCSDVLWHSSFNQISFASRLRIASEGRCPEIRYPPSVRYF